MSTFTKMVVAGAMGLFLIGCSGEDSPNKEDKVAISSEKANEKVEKENKTADFLDVRMKDPGRADSSEYTNPTYAQILYSYSKMSNEILPIEEWTPHGRYEDMKFDPSFGIINENGNKFQKRDAGGLEKRDAKAEWEKNWSSVVFQGEAITRLVLKTPINVKSNFTQRASDPHFFEFDSSGINRDEEPKSAFSWNYRGGYKFSIVNVPGVFMVKDENSVREIEDLRKSGDLTMKIYGGIIGTKERPNRKNTDRIVVADFHFGEAVNSKTGEVIATF